MRVDAGHQFFLWVSFNANTKNEIFTTTRDKMQKGQRYELWYILMHWDAYLLVSEFLNLGIHNNFAILNLLLCTLTFRNWITFDVLLLTNFQKIFSCVSQYFIHDWCQASNIWLIVKKLCPDVMQDIVWILKHFYLLSAYCQLVDNISNYAWWK